MIWLQIFQPLALSLDRIDREIYQQIVLYSDPVWLREICTFIVKTGNVFPVFFVFFAIYGSKKPRAAFILFVATLILLGLSESVASALKDVFQRRRPVYQMGFFISDGGYSFPSAHALNTMAFAVFWASRFKSSAHWFYVFSIIIGFARMLANFHFPGDILAGWVVGYFVGFFFAFLFNWLGKKYPPLNEVTEFGQATGAP